MCYGNACRKKIIHLKTCTVWYVFTHYLLTTLKKNDVTPFFINTSNKDKLTIPERPPLIEIYNILRNIDRSDN